MKINELANYLGFDYIEDYNHPSYKDRKGKVHALIDRRTKLIACTYSTKAQIREYLNQFLNRS